LYTPGESAQMSKTRESAQIGIFLSLAGEGEGIYCNLMYLKSDCHTNCDDTFVQLQATVNASCWDKADIFYAYMI
jgi:hypothetical protein